MAYKDEMASSKARGTATPKQLGASPCKVCGTFTIDDSGICHQCLHPRTNEHVENWNRMLRAGNKEDAE